MKTFLVMLLLLILSSLAFAEGSCSGSGDCNGPVSGEHSDERPCPEDDVVDHSRVADVPPEEDQEKPPRGLEKRILGPQ